MSIFTKTRLLLGFLVSFDGNVLVERRLDAIIVSRICVKFVVLRGKIAFEMSLRDDVGWSWRLVGA